MPSRLRLTARIASLLALCVMFVPALAAESVTDGLKEKARPLMKALSMIGTPYKFGGDKPDKGLDCSGFVRHVYKETADVTLPRTARDMSREGEVVAREALRPGDLVFFNTRKNPNSHVGIYAGNGEFVHASSHRSKQVTVSKMDSRYWSTRFNGARRVLPGSPSNTPSNPQPDTP